MQKTIYTGLHKGLFDWRAYKLYMAGYDGARITTDCTQMSLLDETSIGAALSPILMEHEIPGSRAGLFYASFGSLPYSTVMVSARGEERGVHEIGKKLLEDAQKFPKLPEIKRALELPLDQYRKQYGDEAADTIKKILDAFNP